ncbi:MAG: hypothetical protein K0R73_391 [Candidatus Midichloriaceae bacterium]|jgi:hypothetical protein|nr:hypothetical protein [Candidatus Midichloriaceae bacterium]
MGVNHAINEASDILPQKEDDVIFSTLKQFSVNDPDSKLLHFWNSNDADQLAKKIAKLQYVEENWSGCLNQHKIKELGEVIFDAPDDRKSLVKKLLSKEKKGENIQKYFFQKLTDKILSYKFYADDLEKSFINHVVLPSINMSAVKVVSWKKGGETFMYINPILSQDEYAYILKNPKVFMKIAKSVATSEFTQEVVRYMEFSKDAHYEIDSNLISKENYIDDIKALVEEWKIESTE